MNKHRSLYYALYYADRIANNEGAYSEIERLTHNNLLNDEAIIKAIQSQAKTLSQYFKEGYGLKVPHDFFNPPPEDLRKSLRKQLSNLQNGDPAFKRYMFLTFYLANMSILEPLSPI